MTREAVEDAVRHARWSAPVEGAFSARTQGRHLETQLTKDYHRVEKGLALRSPRRPFGAELTKRLDLGLHNAPDTTYTLYSQMSRDALARWNTTGEIDDIVAEPHVAVTWTKAQKEAIARLFATRRSVRHFADALVDIDRVLEAVDLASNTPSVCNRQATRIHYIDNPAEVLSVLALQNGNKGFGYVPAVMIVTTDLRLFAGAYERNQRWIDGGLFAMSLGWALHAQGLASCMLNWSMNNSATRALRKVAGLQPWEDVVTLIAIGIYPESYRVARSPRRSEDELFISHSDVLSSHAQP